MLLSAMLGFDTDNDTVLLNETVPAYCTAAATEFTAVSRNARTTKCMSSRRTVQW